MSREIVKRRSRGFICLNAHPAGCFRNVEEQVSVISKQGGARASNSRKATANALVIGASTGYGLASRIAAAWGWGAATVGVFFERPPDGGKTATAGYYNTCALHELARRNGLQVASLNADAFSDAAKQQTLEMIRREFRPLDLVIYSLAAPRRVHPKTGEVFNSALKPIGKPFSSKTIELDSQKVVPITIDPASEKEIAGTVAVMGGEDWAMWIEALLEARLLGRGARSVAYSYIGPQVTWPVYKDGTIGRAKQDLERTAKNLNAKLAAQLEGGAWVSVNKAVVTQASAAIPVVPLYLSLLGPALRSRALDEGPIEQIDRLLCDQLAPRPAPATDEAGRIRLDDRELSAGVQEEIARLWPQVTTENLHQITGFAAFQREFRQLFGFEVEGVDYDAPVETDIRW